MPSVFITGRGDRHHARADCSWITGPQKTAVTMGWKVHPAREVPLAEAIQAGKAEPCPLCGGTT